MKKQFLVALHVQSWSQVLLETQKIISGGADGILLVNNGLKSLSIGDYPNLFDIAMAIKEKHPDLIIGINPLDLKLEDALERMAFEQAQYAEDWGSDRKFIDILWKDQSGIIEQDGSARFLPELKHLLSDLKASQGELKQPVQFYGSIAFKYQPEHENLERVAKEAAKHFSAIVTSGSATGSPADINKVRLIKSYIEDVPLVLASGLTTENVNTYAPYVDVFVVGTSLLVDPQNDFLYDEKRIAGFGKKLRQL